MARHFITINGVKIHKSNITKYRDVTDREIKSTRKKMQLITSFYMKKGNVNSINTANYVPTYLIDRKHKQVWDYHKPIKLQKLEII